MPKVKPFAAIHYNTSLIGDLSDVITPPYDNIPEEEVASYLNRSLYNYAHVILPRKNEEIPYEHATKLLAAWREKQVMVKDPRPSYYIYRQRFEVEGKWHERSTLMAAVHLSEFGDGEVRPHENTHGTHKEDRLRILRKTQHNLSHVFAMVRDGEGVLQSLFEKSLFQAPLLQGTTRDGVEHALWRLDPDCETDVERFFESKPLYILDGHHRYSSAVLYAKELGVLGHTDHPAAYTLFCIANSFDPALMVFPTHRWVKSFPKERPTREQLEKAFLMREMSEEELPAFTSAPTEEPKFALWSEGVLWECIPRNWQNEQARLGENLARFPAVWSDEKILKELVGIEPQERAERIGYEKAWQPLWERRNQIGLIVFHAPPAVEAIAKIADENGFLPQKSTYFHPKVAAGVALRELS